MTGLGFRLGICLYGLSGHPLLLGRPGDPPRRESFFVLFRNRLTRSEGLFLQVGLNVQSDFYLFSYHDSPAFKGYIPHDIEVLAVDPGLR
jgi:hypothetical protein